MHLKRYKYNYSYVQSVLKVTKYIRLRRSYLMVAMRLDRFGWPWEAMSFTIHAKSVCSEHWRSQDR